MKSVTLTHYTSGQGAPRYRRPTESLTIAETLTDMFARLRAGAAWTYSGFNEGLITQLGEDSSDKAIYGGIGAILVQFLQRAQRHRLAGVELASQELERLLRADLLWVTGHELSVPEMSVAMAMPEDEFFEAMAMALESGENVAELFRPAATTT